MAISVGNISSSRISLTTTGKTLSHNNNGNVLVVFVSYYYYSSNITAVKYNGTTMTLAESSGTGSAVRGCLIYVLSNPSNGENNIVVEVANSNNQYLGVAAISISGADTTTIVGSTASIDNINDNGGVEDGTASIQLTTSVDNSIALCHLSRSIQPGSLKSGNQLIANFSYLNDTNSIATLASYYKTTTAGNKILGWENSESNNEWALAAIEILEGTVAGPANVKTYKGLASASVKTCKGLAIASVKSKKGLA